MRDAWASAIIESHPHAVSIARLDGIIEYWNSGAAAMLGYRVDEAVGRHVRTMLPSDRYHEFDKVLTLLQHGTPVDSYEVVSRHKDGTLIPLSVTAMLLKDASGRVVALCGIARDIRYRKRLEQQMALQAEAERRYLGRQLHDSLGQQLTGIGMMAASIQHNAKDNPELLDVANRLTEALNEAKAQVRMISKGLLPVSVEPEGLSAALQDLAKQTESKTLRCRFHCKGDGGIENSFVATQLYLIAREAVHNSVKHSGATTIRIGLEVKNDIKLEVRDDGIGFKRQSAGGSGLAIIEQRCSFLQGILDVISSPDSGTRIICKLQRGS